MRIVLNRFAARLLLILLLPIALPIKLFNWLTGRNRKPSYTSTIDGDPLTYDGERPLLIAVWATWAAVWRAATEKVVEQLKSEFSGRCEFAYVECTNRSLTEAYDANVVPVLILRHRGKEVARFVNTLDAEQARQAIERCLA
jgi:hypothetical protein